MEQKRIKSPRRVAVDPASTEGICLDACPYLGLLEDPRTTLAFPHVANHCQGLPIPVEVDLAHQRAYCLSTQYKSCHLYKQSEILPGSMESFAGKGRFATRVSRRTVGIMASVLMLLLILAATVVWWPLPGESMQDVAAMAASLTREAVGDVTELTTAVTAGRMQAIVKESGAAEVPAVLEVDMETAVGDKNEPMAIDTLADSAMLPAVAPAKQNAPDSADNTTDGPLPAAIMQGFASETSGAVDTDVQDAAEPVQITVIEVTGSAVPELDVAAEQSTQPASATVDLPASGMVTINTGALNLRSGPGVEYPTLAVAFNGQQVELLGEEDGGIWVRVRMDDGLEGWMHKDYLAPGT